MLQSWVRRILRPFVLSRPILAILRFVSPRIDLALRADLYWSAPAGERPVEKARELVEYALMEARHEDKQRLHAWLEDWAEQCSSTIVYAEQSIFESQQRLITRHKGGLKGLRLLELGPGHTVGPGLLLYAHGVEYYAAADLFPLAARSSEMYRRLRRRLSRQISFLADPALKPALAEILRRYDAAVDTTKPDAVFDASKIDWRCPVDAAKLPFPDASFDVIYSNAAFEHFMDPMAAAKECARVLAPGGVGLHQIDFRDHRDSSRPLDFLVFDDEEWRRMNADMVCYTNRLRSHDFEEVFAATGLSVDLVEPNLRRPVEPGIRDRLNPRFRDKPPEELEVLSAFFVVRKAATLPCAG
ncbi:MAG: class I SAM-dependent methyltransferase [Planctomycetota bacterium]